MSTRAYHQKASDSKSLWNYTLSPGWSEDAGEVLRKAIMRYGCGNWQKIQKHFPDKTNGQLNLQTQRLFGQQSLAAWNSVHVDPLKIKKLNDAKTDAYRKNSVIVNIGNNLTRAEKATQKAYNIKNHGLNQDVYLRIKVPTITQNKEDLSLTDKVITLGNLYKAYNMIKKRQAKLSASKNVKRVFVDKNESENNNNENENENNNENNENKKTTIKSKNKTAKKSKKSKTAKKKSGKKSVKKKKNRKNRKRTFEDSHNDGNDDGEYMPGNSSESNQAPPKKKARTINSSKENVTDNNSNNNDDVAVTTAMLEDVDINTNNNGSKDDNSSSSSSSSNVKNASNNNNDDENNSSEIEDDDIDINMETKMN